MTFTKHIGTVSLNITVKTSVLKLPKTAMGKSRSLTLDQRHRVLGMLEGGMSVTAAARQIGVHHSSVSHLRSPYEAIGLLKDRRRTSRLQKMSAAEDCYIVMTSRWNRFKSARKVANQLWAATRTRVSTQTICPCLY